MILFIITIILIGLLFLLSMYEYYPRHTNAQCEHFWGTSKQSIHTSGKIPMRKGTCKDEQTTCPERYEKDATKLDKKCAEYNCTYKECCIQKCSDDRVVCPDRYEKDKTKLNKKCVGYECTTEECCAPILGKCKDEQTTCPERYEKDETKLDKTCAEYNCTSEECCAPAPYKLIPGRLQLHSDYIFSRAALPWQAAAGNGETCVACERERKKCEIAARNAKSEAYTYSKYYGCRIQKPGMDYCDRTPTRVLVGKRLKLVANPTLQSDIDQYCYMDEGYHREANLGRMFEFNDGKFFYSIRPDSDTYYKKK